MRPWVKVCGITRPEDARAAAEAGADAVGFILARESPRWIGVPEATAIARELPSRVARVGVVLSLSVAEVRRLVEAIGLSAVQAHGDETPAACRAYGVPVVKAIRTEPGFEIRALEAFAEFPILFDGYAPGLQGGTGSQADWSIARKARERGYRVLLAGGLGPSNLREAVEAVSPIAVDLNSGVESAPGIKDRSLIQGAIAALDGMDPPEESTWPW